MLVPSCSMIANILTGLVRTSSQQLREPDPEPVHLPDEIIEEILQYLPKGKDSQSTLAACCLVSWQWHSIAIPLLYDSPHLYGRNYDPFVRTICPSLNIHIRKSDLAGLVRTLDMGGLVHQGSRSTTARLLGRTKGGLLRLYVSFARLLPPPDEIALNTYIPLMQCRPPIKLWSELSGSSFKVLQTRIP